MTAMIAQLDQPVLEPPSQPQQSSRRIPAAFLAAGLLLASVAGGAAGAAVVSRNLPKTVTTTTSLTSSLTASAAAGSVAALYQQDSPGVVTITAEVSGFGRVGQAIGSGVVVDQHGDIVTNEHVIEGAQRILVKFSDGRTVSASVRAANASEDLAVVQVSVAASSLHPVSLGNSDTVKVGDAVYAIGAPFGLSESLTAGIISGLDRSSTASNGSGIGGLIQTDAPINPGNSGGALINAQGALIAITESIQSPVDGNVGVGFAIPVNTVKQFLAGL